MSRAFIFTLDAVLALIPIFVVIATVSYISTTPTIEGSSRIIRAEKIANDVLESMTIMSDINKIDVQKIKNDYLESMIPDYYNYSYEVYDLDGKLLFNITRGSPSGAENVYVAQRSADIQLVNVEDEVHGITHGRYSDTPPCYTTSAGGGIGQRIYEMSFSFYPDNYDYYLYGIKNSTSVNVFCYISNTNENCSSVTVSNIFMTLENEKIVPLTLGANLCGNINSSGTKYMYLRVTGNPTRPVDVFIVRVPAGTPKSEVNLNNIHNRRRSFVRLKLWME